MNPENNAEFITKNEFNYLADIFNGVMFSADVPLEGQLIEAIDASEPSLLTKWNVDAAELQKKIRYGCSENSVVLVAKILQYWNRDQYLV